ncbi:hypothetical protein [Gordonia amicalis]|uniref:Minor tail protein n=1 Tax=Gordonia amicalis TaxID=89053 RepID=A0ABU4DJR3_9ACTN|nr:hypothetical protein [Gordonia amicalis]MDV6309895.1 hypothetical protein [Gordonia amicalis]
MADGVRIPAKRPMVSNDPLQDFFDGMIDALEDIPIRILIGIIGIVPIVGQPIANALADWLLDTNEKAVDAAESVVSVATQVNYVQQVIALQSGMGVWETGPDRTGTPSFPFGLMNLSMATISIDGGRHKHSVVGETANTTAGGDYHSHAGGDLEAASGSGFGQADSAHTHTVTLSTNPPTVNATANYAPWATVIFKSAAERKVLTWLASKTGTVTTFNLDVYKLEADGSSTLVYSSPNLAGDVPLTIGWMQHLMESASIIADVGDTFEVQFRMTGSGSVAIAGVNFPNPTPLPGFRPYSSGSGRNPSTIPAPATIPTTTRDSMYVGPCPFVSIGIDVGQTNVPRFFFDDFNRSSLGPRWIAYGSMGISSNKVKYTGSSIATAPGAIMYHQPLATDLVEAGFDADLDQEIIGVGIGCTSGLGSGVWLTTKYSGVVIETGAYNSRTARTPVVEAPGSGRYTLRRIRSEDDTHFIYQAYFGDPNATDPILTWADTGGIIAAGIGRRWVAMLSRRNGLIYPSGTGDNWTAADITIAPEETA